jgi:hypothetical protein
MIVRPVRALLAGLRKARSLASGGPWHRAAAAVARFRSSRSWRISPYPDGKRFGFTIVHDADSAYSKRLAPIIDAFDGIGLRITVTVFPFWAAWGHPVRSWQEWRATDPFFAPIAVPLEDEAERDFYLDVAARGHEIGMHTPSETSSRREDVVRAFDLFQSIFGHPPRVYVEHSPGNNLDAQARCGSDSASPYFNTDLLNESGCWIWVCDPETSFPRYHHRNGRLNVLSDDGEPFCPRACEKFGIARAFLRSPTTPADGNGFLSTFTEAAFDKLEADRGLALVYTHLAMDWLDPETRALRADIFDRLTGLAKRNVWFAPACVILDRFAALKNVELRSTPTKLELSNHADTVIDGLTVIAPAGKTLAEAGRRLQPREDGHLVVGELGPRARRSFEIVPVQRALSGT